MLNLKENNKKERGLLSFFVKGENMDRLIVGKIVKVHGIKGAVKVIPVIDDGVNFADIHGVYIDNDDKFYEIINVFAVSDVLGVSFKDVSTIDEASKLVGKFLYADRNVVESLINENSFFIEDLKGSKVYLNDKNGEYIGVLTEIDNFGSADVFYINSSKYKNLSLPHIEGLVKLFDEKSKMLFLDSKVFDEVAVYGD